MDIQKTLPQNKKHDLFHHFVCPIVYSNALPDPEVEAKFLPIGKQLKDFVKEPATFPEHERHYDFHFKGLHLLFDIDLVNLGKYENKYAATKAMGMDPRDAELLADFEALDVNDAQTKVQPNDNWQQRREPMANKQTRPQQRMQRGLPAGTPKATPMPGEPLGQQQQIQLINQSFRDIERPLHKHPTKPDSKARPVAALPIFPDTEVSQQELVFMQFDIPPSNSSLGLLKDCGSFLINFHAHNKTQKLLQGQGLPKNTELSYISDQKYKEERTTESIERDRYIMREYNGTLLYNVCEKHIKCRRERPRTYAQTYRQLLEIKCMDPSEKEKEA